jgi:REP element-mobilizing transposase RayT
VGRPRRIDPPGTWHHVWDRGLAKKPIFEDRRDIRRFQAALARAVRRGDLEVHSFAFLTTHLHLLVRSPKGLLSRALGRVLCDFTRYYNRSRDRDGTVWRGRFCSKPVTSLRYRRHLVRYIDHNPVKAGLAETAWRYEHGSAQRFIFRTPRWLSRNWIDDEIQRRTGLSREAGGRYETAFPPATSSVDALVEVRLVSRAQGPDPLDHLLTAAPPELLAWLAARAQLADGSSLGHPLVDPRHLLVLLARLEAERPGWRVSPTRRAVHAIPILRVALTRDLGGQTYATIALGMGLSRSHVTQLYRTHGVLISDDPDYARTFSDLVRRALKAADGESDDLCLAPK